MFHDNQSQLTRGSQWSIAGLALLSLMALIVTAWILADFGREQEIVRAITRHLPASDLADANELAGELQLQSRLSVLLILNIVASGVALTLLVRAYISSERSLREVRVLATDILASLDQGIITTDLNASILSINPRGRILLDRSDDGTGFSLTDLPAEHGTLSEICHHVLEKQENVRDQDYVATSNGHTRNLRAGCSLLQDHNQQHLGTVIHVRDVTEKSLMEQRLRRMERYMGLGSLAAGLQHEIRNPLAALSLHVQLLNEQLEDNNPSEETRQTLSVIRSEVRRVGGVLEGFRDFASVERLNLAPVDLTELIQRQVDLIRPRADMEKIAIHVVLSDVVVSHLFADEVRLEQVLLNLLVNAMEAMPDGGRLTVSMSPGAESVVFKVSDTGSGIPPDFQQSVFDPYFTTRSEGTGLGLALCDKIIRQHSGSIDFQTSEAGTTFEVSLPLTAAKLSAE